MTKPKRAANSFSEWEVARIRTALMKTQTHSSLTPLKEVEQERQLKEKLERMAAKFA